MKGANFTKTSFQSRKKYKKRVQKGILYLLAILLFIWLVAPFGWLINMSFMSDFEIHSSNLYPHSPVLVNYERMAASGIGLSSGKQHYTKESIDYEKMEASEVGMTASSKVFLGMKNSIIICLSVVGINLLVGSLAGYSFARFRYRGLRLSFLALLMTRMVPPITLIIPFFVIFRSAGMLNTYQALIIAYTSFTIPFTAWIMKGYFDTIPSELDDAALVDGCSRLQVIFKIILPLSAPGLVAASIFTFLITWNEFFFAAMISRDISSQPVTVVVASFFSQYSISYGGVAAAGVVAAVPPIVLALIFQKYLVKGLVAGAIKG